MYDDGMKVLKKGRKQTGWSITILCSGNGNGGGGCSATLLVEQADIYRTESHCRDETDIHATFQCPDCFVLTDIPESKVPYHIRSQVSYRGPGSWQKPLKQTP